MSDGFALFDTAIGLCGVAWNARGLAGVIDRGGPRAFVFNAPGSRGGARDALAVLAPVLTHIVDQLDGADHDLSRPASRTADG